MTILCNIISTFQFFTHCSDLLFILNINMRSLANLNNYFKFETLITSLNPQPDIISVTETWLIEQSGAHCSLIG